MHLPGVHDGILASPCHIVLSFVPDRMPRHAIALWRLHGHGRQCISGTCAKIKLCIGAVCASVTGPVMDLGFLIDHVMTSIRPLRWRDVISSNVPLKVRPRRDPRRTPCYAECFCQRSSSASQCSLLEPLHSGALGVVLICNLGRIWAGLLREPWNRPLPPEKPHNVRGILALVGLAWGRGGGGGGWLRRRREKPEASAQVVASCLDSLRPVVLEDFYDRQDLATCLKASANIPVIAGAPMLHRCGPPPPRPAGESYMPSSSDRPEFPHWLQQFGCVRFLLHRSRMAEMFNLTCGGGLSMLRVPEGCSLVSPPLHVLTAVNGPTAPLYGGKTLPPTSPSC